MKNSNWHLSCFQNNDPVEKIKRKEPPTFEEEVNKILKIWDEEFKNKYTKKRKVSNTEDLLEKIKKRKNNRRTIFIWSTK